MKTTDKYFAEYVNALHDVWGTDQHMIDWSSKTNTTRVVQIHDDDEHTTPRLIAFSKKSIITDFCFGYSTCGQGPEHDEACRTEDAVRKNMYNYFMRENLRRAGYDELLESLRDEENTLMLYDAYYQKSAITNWACDKSYYFAYDRGFQQYLWLRSSHPHEAPFQDENKRLLIEAVEAEKAAFVKRLESWWKRYGAEKIRTWTYWLDE